MEEVLIYLNNNIANNPANIDDLSLQLNYDRDNGTFSKVVALDTVSLVAENNAIVQQWIADGITGTGPGIYECIPFRIDVKNATTTVTIYDGYLDLTETSTFSKIKTEAKTFERYSPEWFADAADGVSFEYLKKVKGTITSADYVYMPYVLSSVPDYLQSIIALIGIYMIEDQIDKLIVEFTQLAAEIVNPFETISAALKTVALIGRLVTLTVSMPKMVKDFITFLIQPVKYHACMNVRTLMQKGATELGMDFFSPGILDEATWSKLYIMPEKSQIPVNTIDNRICGFTSPSLTDQDGFYKGTYGDLVRGLKNTFYAKVNFRTNPISNTKEMYFVRKDYSISIPVYQVPDFWQLNKGYNTDELISNYYLKFEYDLIEKNTIQNWLGNNYQVITEKITYNYADLVKIKNVTTVSIPFARATRKETLTVPETIVKGFLDVIDGVVNVMITAGNVIISALNSVTNFINGIVNALGIIGINLNWNIPSIPSIPYIDLSNIIENRIGMMLLEHDHTDKPKIFKMDVGSQSKFNKISSDNNEKVSAKYFYDNFHYIQSMVPTNDRPNGNQFDKKQIGPVPFSLGDYINIKDNAKCLGPDGEESWIDSLLWKVKKQYAEEEIRISALHSTNLQTVTMEPDGK